MMSSSSPVDATELPLVARWRTALGALAKVMANPTRTDQVLVFSLHANAGSMKHRVQRFLDDPTGRRLFEERRAIDSKTVDLDALAALPEGTLGRAYAEFLRSHGLTPEVFDGPPDNLTDPAISYVVQRLRQTHDLWHVVTGFETDAPSEVALQAFTYAQVRAPSSLILAAMGTLRASRERPTLARDVVVAFRAGNRAERLAVFPWEDHWATPLAEVRALLGVEPAPLAS